VPDRWPRNLAKKSYQFVLFRALIRGRQFHSEANLMAMQALGAVLRHIRKLASAQTTQNLPDGQLLRSFIVQRDERAFSELVNRHGRLVLHVCRQVLGHEQDAEDAFQATFMVLAKKAESIRKKDSLSSWLYGVAYRTAMKAKTNAAKRNPPMNWGKPMVPCEPPKEAALRELQTLLHEEVNRLPEKFRVPFVLCCLEGKSQAEAAEQLGWKGGTLGGRLAQARQRLRHRLLIRGVTLSTVLGAVALSSSAACAAVPAALADATIRTALLFIRGEAVGTISAQALSLAESVMKALTLTNFKGGATLALAAAIVATGVGLTAYQAFSTEPAASAAQDSPRPVAQGDNHTKGPEPKQVRSDCYGDPLPAGAIARVGTARFRHGSQVYCLAFSPDGRYLAGGGYHGDLCLWDRATGKLVQRLVHPSKIDSLSRATAIAFSPDSKILASNKGKASLWEVPSGRLLRNLDTSISDAVCSMAFSPDGQTLGLGTDKGVWLYNLVTGHASRPIPGYTAIVPVAVFSKDGKLLVSGSTDKTARIWDLATGQEVHRFESHDRVVDIALAPDGKWLAAQTTKEVFLWEVSTGKEVHRFPAERHLRSLAFSPDGTRLASANVVWDVTTGKEFCRLAGLPSPGLAWGPDGKTLVPVTGSFGGIVSGALAFAPDGKTLATGGYDGIIRLHDTSSGKEITQANNPSWNRGIMTVCGFGPDGRWLAVRDNGGIHLCETTSGKEIHHFPIGDDYGVSVACPLPVALAPDGSMVIAAGAKAIYRWDTVTGKELGRTPNLRKPEDLGPMAALAFAPGGRTFACAHYEPTIRLWDTTTGTELRQFQADEKGVARLFFLPDGKSLASEGLKGTIRIWDVASGKEIPLVPAQSGTVRAVSPDGNSVVVDVTQMKKPALALRHLASGRELRRIEIRGAEGGGFEDVREINCAFSPDGRLLAVDADPVYYPDHKRTIQLLEVASGKVRARFAGHFGFPGPMAFSPDGKMLATGSSDTTAVIWDVTGRMSDGRLRAEQLSADGLKALWSDLAADDAQAAHRAIWTLAAAPGQALSLLKEKLHAIQTGISPRINELIEALDSNQFAIREKVTGELEELGDSAEPALQKTLAGNPPLEVRRRVEQLLRKLESSPQFLQKLRAVEVLEHIATPEARELLRSLAKGAPEARVTQEAKASLERLAKRPGYAGVPATP
jgi:RNA polymerase sigma factor (sigma-70 family)